MQCIAILLMLWLGLQSAYLILDTRYLLERALEKTYMHMLMFIPIAVLKWFAGSFLHTDVRAVPSDFLNHPGGEWSALAKDPSVAMGIVSTASGFLQLFMG